MLHALTYQQEKLRAVFACAADTLAAIFGAEPGDPLKRWNHPNHLAGYLADLAELLYHKGIQERDPLSGGTPQLRPATLRKYRKAARATSRAAKKVWTKEGRRRFQANWGRITGAPHALTTRKYQPIAYYELVARAAAILCDQRYDDPGRLDYLGSTRGWATITEDDVSDLEIRWRIRDWLSLTDKVVNIPPRERLAAAAAWRVGAHTVAFQIVVDAAAAVVAKDGA